MELVPPLSFKNKVLGMYYQVLERLLSGEAHQCDRCREPQPGHIFLLPAHILLGPLLAKYGSRPEGGELLEHSTLSASWVRRQDWEG